MSKLFNLKAGLGFLAALVLSVQANAATIWQPTDGNVNILKISFLGIDLNGGSLALFEDANNFSGPALVLGSNGGVFEFTDNLNGTYTVNAKVANVSVGTLLITDSNFMFGVKWGAGAYVGDASYVQNPTDLTSYQIFFNDGPNSGNIYAVDLELAAIPDIPVPAAAWLFGSALCGLVAVGRRKLA